MHDTAQQTLDRLREGWSRGGRKSKRKLSKAEAKRLQRLSARARRIAKVAKTMKRNGTLAKGVQP